MDWSCIPLSPYAIGCLVYHSTIYGVFALQCMRDYFLTLNNSSQRWTASIKQSACFVFSLKQALIFSQASKCKQDLWDCQCELQNAALACIPSWVPALIDNSIVLLPLTLNDAAPLNVSGITISLLNLAEVLVIPLYS